MKQVGIALLVLCLTAPAGAGTKAPDAGAVAPAFSLPGSDGTTYTLADFKGEKAVVIAWFPMAFTGG